MGSGDAACSLGACEARRAPHAEARRAVGPVGRPTGSAANQRRWRRRAIWASLDSPAPTRQVPRQRRPAADDSRAAPRFPHALSARQLHGAAVRSPPRHLRGWTAHACRSVSRTYLQRNPLVSVRDHLVRPPAGTHLVPRARAPAEPARGGPRGRARAGARHGRLARPGAPIGPAGDRPARRFLTSPELPDIHWKSRFILRERQRSTASQDGADGPAGDPLAEGRRRPAPRLSTSPGSGRTRSGRRRPGGRSGRRGPR